MKSLIFLAVAVSFLIFTPYANGQMLLTEAQAIPYAQQALASQFDPALPPRPFSKWLERAVGDAAGVNWQLRNCGEQKGALQSFKDDPQACVEVTALFPNDRMVVVMADVGTFDKAEMTKPKIRFIVIEEFGRLRQLKRLSDLQAALRETPQKPRRVETKLPGALPASPSMVSLPTAEFLVRARAQIETAPPVADLRGGAPPPPPASPSSSTKKAQTSETASAPSSVTLPGAVITKVTPVYPAFARMINASGEVRVLISINQLGRVVEAKALNGHPILQSAAEDSARRWVFNPAMLNGKPVPSQTTLIFSFIRPQ